MTGDYPGNIHSVPIIMLDPWLNFVTMAQWREKERRDIHTVGIPLFLLVGVGIKGLLAPTQLRNHINFGDQSM